MNGTITYFSEKLNKGSIQADDGRMLSFDSTCFAHDVDLKNVTDGLRITCNADENGKATSISIDSNQILLDGNIFYKEPKEIGIAKELPVQFELIDKSDCASEKEARSSDDVKRALIEECRNYGGNIVLDYEETKFLRNSIGFSFYMYKGKAHYGVVGQRLTNPGDEFVLSLYDLKHKLDHEKIKENFETRVKGKVALKIAKFSGLILLFIFTLGFIFGND